MFEDIEGETSDPDKIPNGPLGKLVKNWQELPSRPIVNFNPVPNAFIDALDLTELDVNDDVLKMFKWAKAISKGNLIFN